MDTTPISADELDALIPAIVTKEELDAFEANNIRKALNWADGNTRLRRSLLSDTSLRELHQRMFGETWRWAGQYRKTEKNIGIEPFRVSSEVRNLVEDVKCWLEFSSDSPADSSYSPAEITARFHHRLVSIHPFPNGNGRHARLATDLLCQAQGWPLPNWNRGGYIEALQRADVGDFGPIIEFF